MSYVIFTVANTILRKSLAEGEPLTHMKLQKLAYYLHGWHLAQLDAPACVEQVEAWKYGPVWGGLYHALKYLGPDPIGRRDLICEPGDEEGELIFYTVPKTDTQFYTILDKVWREYARYTATELSRMTHQPGSPWAKTRKLGNLFIDNEDIKQHFLEEEVGVVAHV